MIDRVGLGKNAGNLMTPSRFDPGRFLPQGDAGLLAVGSTQIDRTPALLALVNEPFQRESFPCTRAAANVQELILRGANVPMDGRKLVEPFLGLSGPQLLAPAPERPSRFPQPAQEWPRDRGRRDVILHQRFTLVEPHRHRMKQRPLLSKDLTGRHHLMALYSPDEKLPVIP